MSIVLLLIFIVEVNEDEGELCEEDYYDDDLSREGSGEVVVACEETQFGCCPDGVTAAADVDRSSCPSLTGACQHSEFGCCGDGVTAAQGPRREGCPCAETTYGCCADGLRPAAGSNAEGTSDSSQFGRF